MTVGNPADEAQLAELDRSAQQLLGAGRPMRLAGRLDELVALDFRGHPWARLLVGCAASDADPADERGPAQVATALAEFRDAGDGRGEAYACFVLGCRALEQGDINGAAQWWEAARQADGPAPPGLEIMLAHRCLDAYAAGRLREAVAMSQEAVALARLRGHPRAEATALVNLAFLQLWAGDFTLAAEALNQAEDGFGEVTDPFDRYEAPLCASARGVLCALRGQAGPAGEAFGTAVSLARDLKAEWYEAIARALRAEFTAAADSRRARADAQWASAELERRGDQWWGVWAYQAAGVAALAAGMPDTAENVLRETLGRSQPALERARTRLLLGEALIHAGRTTEAATELREAEQAFAAAGARYWAVRSQVRLARAVPGEAQAWWVQARGQAAGDPAYRLLFGGDSLRLLAFGPGRIECDGRPVRARTHNCERALFLLTLAGPAGMHVEELADRLWADDFVEQRKLLARVRTLLWEMRQVLGSQAWRLERDGPIVRLDTFGVSCDLLEARIAARTASGPAARDIAARLREPLLTRWRYEEWVQEEHLRNTSEADGLACALGVNAG
jgi:tetratricopeptide (TPR) repeat protein